LVATEGSHRQFKHQNRTIDEVKQRMREALELHLRGMREDGLPIPEPSLVEYVDAA
jgi:predicted RNase H-like HicB family nuclease